MPEVVELPEQDHCHHEQRRQGSAREERAGFSCVFVRAFKAHFHAGWHIRFSQESLQLRDNRAASALFAGIAAHVDDALAFAPLDLAHAGRRLARHEQ